MTRIMRISTRVQPQLCLRVSYWIRPRNPIKKLFVGRSIVDGRIKSVVNWSKAIKYILFHLSSLIIAAFVCGCQFTAWKLKVYQVWKDTEKPCPFGKKVWQFSLIFFSPTNLSDLIISLFSKFYECFWKLGSPAKPWTYLSSLML